MDESRSPPPTRGEVQLWVGGKRSRAKSDPPQPSPWWWRLLMVALAGTGVLGGVFAAGL